VHRFHQEFKLSVPLLLDTDGRVTSVYKVVRHPHTVVIDRRGVIGGRADGERDWTHPLAREWIARLLGGAS
jgi:peroxiredoxin